MRPADYFRAYKIYKFANHAYLARWVHDLLGPTTLRRLARVLGEFNEGMAPRHRAQAIIGFLARPRVSAAYLSGTAGFIHEADATILGLLEDRKRVLDLGCHIGHRTTWLAGESLCMLEKRPSLSPVTRTASGRAHAARSRAGPGRSTSRRRVSVGSEIMGPGREHAHQATRGTDARAVSWPTRMRSALNAVS
jgi:hypothetical protein